MGCCLLLIVLTNEGGRKEVIGLFVYSGCGLRDAGYAMRVTGCAMWVTGLGHRDPRCGSRDAGYWVACVSVKISRSGSSVHAAIAARNVRNFSSRAAYSRFQIPRFQIIPKFCCSMKYVDKKNVDNFLKFECYEKANDRGKTSTPLY